MKKLKAVCILFVLLTVLTSSVLAAGGGGQAGQQRTTRINVTQTNNEQSVWHHATVAFADYLNKNSNGRYDAHVFPNASLSQGNYTIMMEQLQSGAVQVAVESLTVIAAYNQKPGILQLPFIFEDVEHVLRFVQLNDPTWQGWLKEFENSNFVILGGSPRPMRQLNNNQRVIRTVADMQGMRFRVPVNPFFVSIFETLGAVAVPAPSSEIYTGIQLGTFNGEDNSIQTQFDFRTFEVAKFFTVANYIADLSFIYINRDFYYGLSEDDRQLFRRAAQEFVRVDMAQNQTYLQTALDGGRRLNVEFWTMPEANKRLFQERLTPFLTEFRRNYTQAEWDAFQAAVRRSAP